MRVRRFQMVALSVHFSFLGCGTDNSTSGGTGGNGKSSAGGSTGRGGATGTGGATGSGGVTGSG